MIISTKKGAPKEELEKIVDKFEKQGLDVTLITGKDYNVYGLVGDTTKIDEREPFRKTDVVSLAVRDTSSARDPRVTCTPVPIWPSCCAWTAPPKPIS